MNRCRFMILAWGILFGAIVWTYPVYGGDEGLVGYWSFSENEGTVSTDKSGSGNNGTIHGASWTSGKDGGGLEFDGEDDYVVIPNSESLTIQGDLTISAWIYSKELKGGIVTQRLDPKEGRSDYVIRINTGNLEFAYHNGTEWSHVGGGGEIQPNQWSLIAVTRDVTENKIRFYINGELTKTSEGKEYSGGWINSVTIGGAKRHDGLFKGIIDEVRIYNWALSENNIMALFNGKASTITKPPVKARPRDKISLNGEWQLMPVQDAQGPIYPPSRGEWLKQRVPEIIWSEWTFKNIHWVWYKREFKVPEYMRGKRLKLKFMAVNFDAQVYVNGKHAGGHFGGYTPFMMDITDLVKKDGPNELCVAVTDWTAVCKNKPAGTQPPGGSIISPIGGTGIQWRLIGIWQPVYLLAYPEVYVEDVFVMTSVRKKEINVQVTVRNEGSLPYTSKINNAIYDGDNLTTSLQSKQLEIGANQSHTMTIVEKWENPHLWALDDPHLYQLKTTIGSDTEKIIDELSTRFGFREVWTEGKRFMLNGIPITLFGSTYMGHDISSIEGWLANLKRIGARCIRLHTQPWSPDFLEAADRLGILLVDEAAVYMAFPYAIEDETFWKNFTKHMQELVMRDRNHPSLFMYSLGNEVLFGGGSGKPEVWRNGWAELADFIRGIDPTRLIFCSADGDPRGKMDMIGFHYTNERYQGNTDYPNQSYNWINEIDEYLWQTGWKWDKPIFYDEFVGYFPYHPHYDAFWMGDKAYIPEGSDYLNQWSSSLVQSIIEQVSVEIDGLRYQHMTGILPFPWVHVSDEAQERIAKNSFAPLFLDIKEWGHNFRSGERIQKTLIVHNDLFKPLPLKVRWQAKLKDEIIDTGEVTVNVHPGKFEETKVSFPAPQVSQRSKLNFEVTLYNGEEVGYQVDKEYTIFPSALPALKITNTIGLYDTTGSTQEVFRQLGIRYTTIKDISRPFPSDLKVLIIGAGSLDKQVGRQAKQIAEFVSGGGRVICLEQEEYIDGWVPLQLSHMEIDVGKKHTATVAFPRSPDHPLLDGFEPEDFKFWSPDNIVAKNSPLKPLKGNFKIVIDAGGISTGGQGPYNINGLSWVPVLEVYHGKGFYLLSQLRLVEKFTTEPVAQEMLIRMINYAEEAPPQVFRQIGLLTDTDSSLVSTLNQIGLVYDNLSGRLAQTDLSRYGILLIGGSGSVWQEVGQNREKLKEFVQTGGRIWLHNLQPEQIESLQPLLDLRFKLQKASIEPLYKIHEDAIISGLSNHELYWREEASFDQIGAMRQIIENSFEAEDTPTRVKILTKPAGLVKVELGKGFFLIDQLLWDTTVKNHREGMRIATILLTNLGAQVQSLSVKPEDYFQVTLTPYCTLNFSNEKELGWSDGEKGFKNFPVGEQLLNGVPFRIIDSDENEGRSVIALASNWKDNFSKEVRGISIGQNTKSLYFLQSCSFQDGAVFGRGETDVARYVIHYDDGREVEIPVRNNMEVWEWFAFPVPKPYAEVAWVGRRPGELVRQIGAYCMEWLNPEPDKTIVSLDFISAMNEPVPILIAVTGSK